MPQFVEIAINLPAISGMYHYHLPEELREQAFPGSLVVVPFGKQMVQGVIWRLIDSPEVAETRPVETILDPEPVLQPVQLALAEWLAHETLAPLSTCFDLMIPPGLSQQVDTLYQLNPQALPDSGISPLQKRLATLLTERGALRGRQIDAAFGRLEWKPAALTMQKRGWLAARSILPPPSARARQTRTIQLAVPPDQIDLILEKTTRKGSEAAYQRRKALLDFLVQQPGAVETAWAFAGAGGGTTADLQKLEELGLVILGESEVWRDPLERMEFVLSQPPALTAAQKQAWETVKTGISVAASGLPTKPHLLFGITGSGKTEIYLQAVAETLRLGKQALVLVPEIALTPQTVRRFAARFPGQVGLVHSRLTPGERYDTWRRARSGSLPVIVGPRSALFTALPNLGLIILDEFHEESYYQDDVQPCYHAVEVALALARLSGSLVLLGSATPDVTTMQRARAEGWPIVHLPERILAHREAVHQQFIRLGQPEPDLPAEGESASLSLPTVKIIDMRQELKAGNRTIFSRELRAALEDVLAAKQQAILFLNRRGSATYVFCRECGATLKCPRCDLPLTFHATADALICHTCNYRRKLPAKCPACGSASIRQLGLGTERVETEVQAQFPGARTLRWDAETTRQKDAHDLILGHFSAHRADILIGTQMIAKGLDLPLVTLVGVILADTGLTLPDFRASERGFQLLTQVAGRAGRSPLGGRVVLQTYQPGHYAIQAASRHDYEGFFRQELAFRRQIGYPPFSRLARLELLDDNAQHAEQAARDMARNVEQWIASGDFRATTIIGPAPCFFSRQGGLYRWQIILRGPDPASVLRGHSFGSWRVQMDPPSLL
jgi:primosomal protein N' (replication factor Y) (superfamily II helicase)